MIKRLKAGALLASLLIGAPGLGFHAAVARQAQGRAGNVGHGPGRSSPARSPSSPRPSPPFDASRYGLKPASGALSQFAQNARPGQACPTAAQPAAQEVGGLATKASQLIARLRKALRRSGVERFDVVGGSALALLEAADTGELSFRDFDIAVVAHGLADKALTSRLARAIADELGADFDPASVKQRLRERDVSGKAERYNAGHGSFIESSFGQIDLSVFHQSRDLSRQGLLSWERIRIPIDAGFHLPAFLSALRREGYERLREARRIKDPTAGWADLKAGRIRLTKARALALAPHLHTLRLLNQIDKRGLALSPELEAMFTKLFPARAPPELGWLVHNLDRVTRRAGAAAIFRTLAKIGFFAGWADPLAEFLNKASTEAVSQIISRAAPLGVPRFERLAALLQASTPAEHRSWLTQGILDFDPGLYRKMLGIASGPLGIIASVDPSSLDAQTIGGLIRAGASWLRVNLAHNDAQDTRLLASSLRQVLGQTPGGGAVRLLFDLPGGKIRTGPAPQGGSVTLRDGSSFTLLYGAPARPSTAAQASVDYEDLSPYAKLGGRVLLHQNKIELLITAVAPGRIETRVVSGGTLRGRATVDLLGADPAFPRLREQDRRKIGIAVENGADFIGVSMVRRPEQMDAVREELDRLSARRVKLVSKIETLSALENIEAIVERSDLVMIAGGDLATAVGSEEALRAAQIKIADAAARHGKGLIAATGYEGPDAPAKVERARDFGASFILLKGTAVEPDPVGLLSRLAAIIQGLVL